MLSPWAYHIFEGRDMEQKIIIPGTAIHAEMELRGRGSRIGHAQRAAAKAHVDKMLELGYLTGKDAGARANFIEKAETAEQVAEVIRDLPPLPVPAGYLLRHPDWDAPKFFVPAFVLLSVLSVFFGASPFIAGVLMGFFHKDAIMTALGVPMVIIGILGLAASTIVLCEKLSDAKKRKAK
jgi:hypothetical protein